MKIIDNKSATNASNKTSFAVPVGSYRKLLLNFASTLDTGQGSNLVGSDFGHIVLKEGNLPPSRVRADIVDAYHRINKGNTIHQKDIDTDTLVSWFFSLPLHLPYDNETVLRVEKENHVFLEVEYASTMATRLASNTMNVELWAEEREGTTPYRTVFTSTDFPIVSGPRTHPLGVENVERLFIEYDTTLTKAIWYKDDDTPLDSDWDGMLAHQLEYNHIEDYNPDSVASTLDFVQIEANSLRKHSTLLSNQNRLQLEGSGADTITVGIFAIDYLGRQKYQNSVDSFAGAIGRKLSRKQGYTRTLEVLEELNTRKAA